VDDDTVSFNCYPSDSYVQPGSNDYLVVAVAPVRRPSGIVLHSHFYRSTDMGRTFSPGVQLDTFSGYSQQPHVVADSGHIISNYSGSGFGNQSVTLARTLFTPEDTWGPQVSMQEYDTIYSSFTNGAKLAIDPQSVVHTGLMFADRQTMLWNTFYTYSTDCGLTGAQREVVDSQPIAQWDPNIAVDDDGHAYLVWQDMRNPKAQIWFSTNALVGVAERKTLNAPRITLDVRPNPCRSSAVLHWTIGQLDHSTTLLRVYDASGRLVHSEFEIRASAFRLDLRSMPAGAYFIVLETGSCRATARLVLQH